MTSPRTLPTASEEPCTGPRDSSWAWRRRCRNPSTTSCRGALRRAEYAAGDCGRGGVAHSRSLWTNRGVFEDERDRTAFDAKIWAGSTVGIETSAPENSTRPIAQFASSSGQECPLHTRHISFCQPLLHTCSIDIPV